MDNVVHTVTSDNGVFDSGDMENGKSFSYTFNQEGTFTYYCIPHPFMKGTVIVTSSGSSSGSSQSNTSNYSQSNTSGSSQNMWY